MILSETWMILVPLQKLPKNVGDLGKLIVAKGFKKLPKVQKIANSGHTGYSVHEHLFSRTLYSSKSYLNIFLLIVNNKARWPSG